MSTTTPSPQSGAAGAGSGRTGRPLRVAVQMDHIRTINIAGDSAFALMLEAQARGHELFHYTPDRLAMIGDTVTAGLEPVTVRDEPGNHFTLGENVVTDLSEVDVVLMRQDPPFDMAYVAATHMLEKIHPRTLVVNDPAAVRNAPEKLFVTEFPDLMPETLITRDRGAIDAFRAKHGDIVMKPLFGHGGAAVFRITADDLNYGSLYDFFAATFREPWVIQRFLPNVSKGDKRILLVDGEFAGAVNRVPQEGDLRSNMVRGGAAREADLSEREREICARLGPSLREKGLILVGIDVIDGFLTEINVTAPTGIRAVAKLGGPDIAARLWDTVEAKRATS
jgi:glutathione synthase